MRVITTQLYFPKSQVHWKLNDPQTNPGLGVAWFRLEEWSDPLALHKTLESYLLQEKELIAGDYSSFDGISRLTELWIQQVKTAEALRLLGSPTQIPNVNIGITKFLLDADIVLEQSPPHWEKFGNLLKKSPGPLIGTFLGYETVPQGHELFMWLTIPLGIIVVTSAIGVGNGLSSGLNRWIEEKFKKPPEKKSKKK